MLRSYRKSNKYQAYSLWFDPIGARTQNLPHAIHYTTVAVKINGKEDEIVPTINWNYPRSSLTDIP